MSEFDAADAETTSSALVPWAVMVATTLSCYAVRKWCQACAHNHKMAIASEAGYDRLLYEQTSGRFELRPGTSRLAERAFLISENRMKLPSLP